MIVTGARLMGLQCGTEYKRSWKNNVEILERKKRQGLPEELDKIIIMKYKKKWILL